MSEFILGSTATWSEINTYDWTYNSPQVLDIAS